MKKTVTIAGVATGILFGTAGIAGAAEPQTVDLSLNAGVATLHVNPAGGYTGTLSRSLTYHGTNGNTTLVHVEQPDGIYFQGTDNWDLQNCGYGPRRSLNCFLSPPMT